MKHLGLSILVLGVLLSVQAVYAGEFGGERVEGCHFQAVAWVSDNELLFLDKGRFLTREGEYEETVNPRIYKLILLDDHWTIEKILASGAGWTFSHQHPFERPLKNHPHSYTEQFEFKYRVGYSLLAIGILTILGRALLRIKPLNILWIGVWLCLGCMMLMVLWIGALRTPSVSAQTFIPTQIKFEDGNQRYGLIYLTQSKLFMVVHNYDNQYTAMEGVSQTKWAIQIDERGPSYGTMLNLVNTETHRVYRFTDSSAETQSRFCT